LGALLFVATLGLSAALAWQAVRSAASHRAAAEASLSHHATIAAWHFGRAGRSWVGWGMDQAGEQLLRGTMQPDPLPGPELVSKVLAQKDCDDMCMTAARTVFRVLNQPGAR